MARDIALSGRHAMLLLRSIRAGVAVIDATVDTVTVAGEEFPIGLYTKDGSLLSTRCLDTLRRAMKDAGHIDAEGP